MDPLRAQALYYLASGLWPVVHLRSFMAITGPKQDTWLVQTFGALVASVGWALLAGGTGAARRQRHRTGAAVALTLAACDAWFVARGRIRPIYLIDAVAELALATALLGERPGRLTARR